MLEVRHIRKAFTSVTAVDDVSFDVKPGQIFGLIGPNGAGKSTTIKMIMDILQPDAGTIRIDGVTPGIHTRNAIGYLPEERGLYRKNKVMNVIAYLASLKGMDPSAARRAASPWMERFQLTEKVTSNVEELSKGNQQKVQFILSILHNPKLVVLDELFSGLDPVNQVLMKDALLDLRKNGRAVIFSTHQMEYAEKLCDDLILINKGKIVLEGSPASIKQRYGRNSIRLEFQGDGGFLSSLPGVTRADVFRNYAEVELAPEADRRNFLRTAAEHLDIEQYARIEPSLQSIFIDTVGMPTAEPEPEAPVRTARAPMHPRVKKAALNLVLSLLIFLGMTIMQLAAKDGSKWGLIGILAVAVGIAVVRFLNEKKKAHAETFPKEGGVQ